MSHGDHISLFLQQCLMSAITFKLTVIFAVSLGYIDAFAEILGFVWDSTTQYEYCRIHCICLVAMATLSVMLKNISA